MMNGRKRMWWTSVPLVCLIIASACDGEPPEPDTSRPGGRGTERIDAETVARYGVDANGNGVVDMPNTHAYVNAPVRVNMSARRLAGTYPAHWPVESTEDAEPSDDGPWRWTISPVDVEQDSATLPSPPSTAEGLSGSNDNGTLVTYTTDPGLEIELYEGEWEVELARLDADDNANYWKTDRIEIADILIVQLGDSYSSGEGAPDRPASDGYWGDDGSGGNGTHAKCHRSSRTWGSVAAQYIEDLLRPLSPTGSVTYVNIACSGAEMADMESQLEEMTSAIGSRTVDILLLSIGGNDAGFANALAAYVAREPIDLPGPNPDPLGPNLDQIADAIESGSWTTGPFSDVGSVFLEIFDEFIRYKWGNKAGLDDLPDLYRSLSEAFSTRRIDPSSVYVLEYPDPLVRYPSNPDEACGGDDVLTSVVSSGVRRFEIGRAEQQHARNHLVKPLNSLIRDAAASEGWHTVAAEDAFYGDAICQDPRMVVRHEESQRTQGDHDGTMHPNAEGYEELAERFFGAL